MTKYVKDFYLWEFKSGMKFRLPSGNMADYVEVLKERYWSDIHGQYIIDVVYKTYDDTYSNPTIWLDYELEGFLGDLELMDGYDTNEPVKQCWHYNKKKVIVSNVSGYWLCPECRSDLGTLTEEEYKLAVKELYGGKECKRAPEISLYKRRR